MEILTNILTGPRGRDLLGFVYRRVKDKAIAKDIVQDVYIKIHTKMDQLKSTDKLIGWVYQIARNAIADHFRAKARPLPTTEADSENENSLLNECVMTCLGEMLLTLPEKYRQAIELTEYENLSQTELALRLNLSYSGAKSRVQRAKAMLKDKMEKAYRIQFDPYGNVMQCENKVPCGCEGRYAEVCD